MASASPGKLWRFLTGRICIFLSAAASGLPLSWRRFIGKWGGLLAWRLARKTRGVTLANLRTTYPDAERRAIVRMARRAFVNAGIVAAELSQIRRIDARFVREQVDIEGVERLDLERGGIIIGAHAGNWEWMAPIVRTLHGKVAEVVRPFDDQTLSNYVDKLRRANGVETIVKSGAAGEITRRVRNGFLTGILIDQSPRNNAAPVTFFGRRCWCTAAPVVCAIRTKAPLHAMACLRQPDGRYRLTISQPIQLNEDLPLREGLQENAQRCTDAVEALLQEDPAQWLWLHRRWKRRPALERAWKVRISAPLAPKNGRSRQ
jgi:KDO2-lipid IV(A) lauroyltransferase